MRQRRPRRVGRHRSVAPGAALPREPRRDHRGVAAQRRDPLPAGGAVPSRDWSVLYAATNDGTSTTLRTLDPVTGAEVASRTVPGVFTVRVVSEDGAAVALAPPMPDGFDTYHPPSKDPTPS